MSALEYAIEKGVEYKLVKKLQEIVQSIHEEQLSKPEVSEVPIKESGRKITHVLNTFFEKAVNSNAVRNIAQEYIVLNKSVKTNF